MGELTIYLTSFLAAFSVVLAVLAWMPQLAPVPRLPKPVFITTWAGRQRPMNPRASSALKALLMRLGKPLTRTMENVDQLGRQLEYVGSRLHVQQFAGLKVLMALIGGFVALVILREVGTIIPVAVILAMLMGFVIPDLWLRSRINRRHQAITRLLPEVIDLLALCVGAGLDFLGALNRVVTARGFRRQPLIDELAVVVQEVKLGKRRAEALKAMARRVELKELSSFVRTLVQADRMGTPISEVLAIHSEDVRIQRFARAERMALKAPIKILFPLIFFIMPCVGLIVAAPILINFTRMNPFGQ